MLLRFRRLQEMQAVEAVEAARQRQRAGLQVLRRRDAGGRLDEAGLRALLAQPLEQGIGAQRDAGDEVGPQAAQDPVDLGRVAGVIGARQQVRLAAAAAPVDDHAAPAGGQRTWPSASGRSGFPNCLRGRGRARRGDRCRGSPAGVDVAQSRSMKSPSGVVHAFAAVVMRGPGPHHRRPDRLQVAVAQPGGARSPGRRRARRGRLPGAPVAVWSFPGGASWTGRSTSWPGAA